MKPKTSRIWELFALKEEKKENRLKHLNKTNDIKTSVQLSLCFT